MRTGLNNKKCCPSACIGWMMALLAKLDAWRASANMPSVAQDEYAVHGQIPPREIYIAGMEPRARGGTGLLSPECERTSA